MEEQTPNINVIRSVWRRLKKDIKLRDLQPVKDVKAGGAGVTGKSKDTTAAQVPRAAQAATSTVKESQATQSLPVDHMMP